jgi:DNA-binding MarR family transcriptional regulator
MAKIVGGYGMLQRKVMQLKDLTIQAKALYALLVSYTGADDYCFPSVARLCEDLSLSKPMIIKYLKELEAKGLIVKSQLNEGSFNNRNRYEIHTLEEEKKEKSGDSSDPMESKTHLTSKVNPTLPSESKPDLTFNITSNIEQETENNKHLSAGTKVDNLQEKNTNYKYDKNGELDITKSCMERWNNFYRAKTGVKFQWGSADSKSKSSEWHKNKNTIEAIYGKITTTMQEKQQLTNPETIVDTFDAFLQNITDKWTLEKLNLNTVNYKYNDLIKENLNKTSNGNKQQGSVDFDFIRSLG